MDDEDRGAAAVLTWALFSLVVFCALVAYYTLSTFLAPVGG